jgi:hypothetical protein
MVMAATTKEAARASDHREEEGDSPNSKIEELENAPLWGVFALLA